jgi:hypothetical protein
VQLQPHGVGREGAARQPGPPDRRLALLTRRRSPRGSPSGRRPRR